MSREVLKAISSAGESVLGIAVLVALGAWGGMYLDDRLHTTPWLSVSLSLLGMCLGLARMVATAMKADKMENSPQPGVAKTEGSREKNK